MDPPPGSNCDLGKNNVYSDSAMQLSQSLVIFAIEIYVLLILISGLLLFYARKQHLLVRRQQEKLHRVIDQLRNNQTAPASTQPDASYKKHLHAQLLATRSRFEGLLPDADITAIRPEDSSHSQYGLALRYQYLKAEEEAIIKGDGPLQIDWQIFAKLVAPLPAPTDPLASDDELASYKKRVENLEKFRQLFFDMEQQWQDAQQQAANYLQQLMSMAEGVENKEGFTEILMQYHGVHSAINQSLAYGKSLNSDPPATPRVITRVDLRSNEEIIKLRNVAADQHRIITQLQRKLEGATSAEAKEAIIGELKQQLQRQIRFVQEAETCIRVLEDELATANERLGKQHQELQEATHIHLENQRVKETLETFTFESKDLMKNILALEKENELLKANTDRPEIIPSEDLEKLRKIQMEFSELQNQYVALETKYLNLKLGS